MTLQKIDQRLALFPEYLRYSVCYNLQLAEMKTVNIGLTSYIPMSIGYAFTSMGRLYTMYHGIMTFDQWLHQTGHEDLIIYSL